MYEKVYGTGKYDGRDVGPYADDSVSDYGMYSGSILSTKARDKNGVKPGELEALFHQRVKDKCILLTRTQVSVQIEKDEIEVIAGGSRRNIKVSVIRRAAITEPEKKIRNQR